MFQDFHYCGLEPNNVIVNYDNRLEVQTCELDGLAEYVAFPSVLHPRHCVDQPPRAASIPARNTCAGGWRSTAMTCCPSASMASALMQQNVRIPRILPLARLHLRVVYADIAATPDLMNITSRLTGAPYITQEVSP